MPNEFLSGYLKDYPTTLPELCLLPRRWVVERTFGWMILDQPMATVAS